MRIHSGWRSTTAAKTLRFRPAHGPRDLSQGLGHLRHATCLVIGAGSVPVAAFNMRRFIAAGGRRVAIHPMLVPPESADVAVVATRDGNRPAPIGQQPVQMGHVRVFTEPRCIYHHPRLGIRICESQTVLTGRRFADRGGHGACDVLPAGELPHVRPVRGGAIGLSDGLWGHACHAENGKYDEGGARDLVEEPDRSLLAGDSCVPHCFVSLCWSEVMEPGGGEATPPSRRCPIKMREPGDAP